MTDLFDFAATLARVTAAAHGGPPLPPAREHGLRVHLGTPGTAAEDRDRILRVHAEQRKDALTILNLRLENLARARQAAGGKPFATADDVIRMLELWEDAPGPDRRWTGAVWRQGPWRKTGQYVPSLRRKCHGRPIPVWVLDESRAK